MTYTFPVRVGISLIILLFFISFRRLMQRFTLGLLHRKQGTLFELLDEASHALEAPFNYLWLVSGFYLTLATSPFIHYPSRQQPDLWLSESFSLSLDFIPISVLNQGYGTLLVVGLGWAGYRFVTVYEKALIHMGSKFTLLDNALIIRFTSKIIRFIIIVISISIVISQYFDIAGILTSVGLAGAAVTFIAKDTLANIMSGIVLMIDKPFNIGDWIQLSNLEGVVEDVSFRSTRIRTFDQGIIVVPNATLSNDNILNWSMMPKRRCRFSFGVTYDTSKENLETFVESAKVVIRETEGVEEDTVLVFFDQFGSSSLNLIMQYYSLATDYASYAKLKETINFKLMALAKQQGIDIAFPTQTLYIKQED